jgi:hypothetical protein
MGRRQDANGNSTVDFGPVGDVLYNGYDNGGARFYPWDTGLAIVPTSMYSDYLGTGSGVPTDPPAGVLPDTAGEYGGTSPNGAQIEASAHPFGRTSPLPWVLAGLLVLFIAHKRGG